MKLNIATCQFPVDGEIDRNLDYILRQMRQAADKGAHVAHFSEVCLPGYAGVDLPSMAGYDWDHLHAATQRVCDEAKRLKLWTILGSAHRLSGRHKPHNSLYVINDRGDIVHRYDKMFCTGPRDGSGGDLMHYSPGDHLPVFKIRGITCGTQICHDFRYQELYRELKRKGIQLVFHSYHNAHKTKAALRKSGNVHGTIVPPTMQAYAANNHMWISANNSSRRESCWPSFAVRPDGVITGRLRSNVAGVLITTIDTAAKFYDASRHWRDRAMKGVLHSGKLVRDRRSDDRTSL